MPAELIEPRVYSVDRQRQFIKDVSNVTQYGELHWALFRDNPNGYFSQEIAEGLPFSWPPPQEFLQLLATGDIMGAQYGYDTMTGCTSFRYNPSWKIHPFHPKHLLALLSHIGKVNEQASPLKRKWEKAIKEKDPNVAVGIWRYMFSSRDSIVDDVPGNVTVGAMTSTAAVKVRQSHLMPICLYDEVLNPNFAAVGFTGLLAENMRPDVFEDFVLPRVVHALRGIFDPLSIFLLDRKIYLVSWTLPIAS